MELEDLKTTLSILKSMKDYKKVAFFESPSGKDFIKGLCCDINSNEEQGKAIGSLLKAVGHPGFNMKGESLEKNIVLGESGFSMPVQLAIPEDRVKQMSSFPDKRLNGDAVYRSVGARVLDPQIHWTKQSDLCHMFGASAESIEAALFRHVGEGRLAYEKLNDQMIFARILE